MSRATIVSFHQYAPQGHTDYYRIYFDYFKKTLKFWGKEIDKLYIVDQNWNFTNKDIEDLKLLTKDFEIMKSIRTGHHWIQFIDLLPRVKEDNIMVMDNDMYIYKEGLVAKNFELLESGQELSTIFDGSGGMREKIWEKFPQLKEKAYIRIGPYLCFIKKSLLKDLDFEPKYYKPGIHIDALDYNTIEGDWLDSFGEATLKILAKNPKMSFIQDDRTSLFFLPEHKINSVYVEEPTGCYHLRNWNLGLHFINESKHNKTSYYNFIKITPIQESFRLLGWLWCLSDSLNKLSNELKNDILNVIKDYGAMSDEWLTFITQFKELHKWI